MAFRPIALSSQVTYVSHLDPAVDRRAMLDETIAASDELQAVTDLELRDAKAWGRFLDDYIPKVSNDPNHSAHALKFKQGETPTKFVLGVIPAEEMVRIADETREKPNEKSWRAFLAALRGIEGWPENPIPTRKVNDVEYVDPTWIKKHFVRGLRLVANDAGVIAWMWNQMTEAEVKNS